MKKSYIKNIYQFRNTFYILINTKEIYTKQNTKFMYTDMTPCELKLIGIKFVFI